MYGIVHYLYGIVRSASMLIAISANLTLSNIRKLNILWLYTRQDQGFYRQVIVIIYSILISNQAVSSLHLAHGIEVSMQKPFKTTFFGTPSPQSLRYFGLRLAKVYIEKFHSETCLIFQYTPLPISIQSIGAIDGGTKESWNLTFINQTNKVPCNKVRQIRQQVIERWWCIDTVVH